MQGDHVGQGLCLVDFIFDVPPSFSTALPFLTSRSIIDSGTTKVKSTKPSLQQPWSPCIVNVLFCFVQTVINIRISDGEEKQVVKKSSQETKELVQVRQRCPTDIAIGL